jgi:hypothetical protein
MFYELQKTLTIESYKTIDIYEFAKMYHYTNQTLRDVNNKSRREEFSDDAEREKVIVIVNSNQINQNVDKSISCSWYKTSELSFYAITQSSSFENQVNIINCYNCEKSDHISRNCRQLRKMNLNSFVREMEKIVSNSEIESESKKE